MTTTCKHYDVVIVGAGIVGASLACKIAQNDIRGSLQIALIEANYDQSFYDGDEFDPRVAAITPASQRFLMEISAWTSIAEKRVCTYTDMEVWDGEGTAHVHFSSAEIPHECLGHIVENSVIVNRLREKIARHTNINVIQPAKIVELQIVNTPGVRATLDNGLSIETDLLVAADGANSKVRELAKFNLREWDYGHTAIITTVQTENHHLHTAWQRFMHTGPLAFLPLPSVDGKHFCSIVWSAEHLLADKLMVMDNEDFCKELGVAFEYKLGKILHAAPRCAIPLRQRHATTYIQPNIVLVGDAAHNIHPLAGQGVNLGLLDVAALAREIQRAQKRGIPPFDFSILRRYQRQRLANNLSMMSVMEGFKQLFASESLHVTALRNLGMRHVNQVPELKKIIMKTAMGLA